MDFMKDPRHLALLILVELSRQRLTLDQVLDTFSGDLALLSRKDRSLANALVFGVLRWQEYLDWVLARFSARNLTKIQDQVLILLRIGLCQTSRMERIPVSAAVNTSVEIAKKTCGKGAAGFVNAVLRKACTGWQDLEPPDPGTDPENHIRIRHSMPGWLVRRWLKRYGMDETRLLCRSINTIPPITVRVNTLKTNHQALEAILGTCTSNPAREEWAPDAISFTRPSLPVHEMEAFGQGLFQVQDQAAQIVSLLVDPRPGETVMDVCAGLGGKTGHLAQLMENKGSLAAMDACAAKLESLGREMERLGFTMVETRPMDLLAEDDYQGLEPADRVLVDAPCSGLGVLRRNPDSKWSRTPRAIKRLAEQQKKILARAADLVKPGGTLVYAVCSCEPEENEAVIRHFLEKHGEFSVRMNHDRLQGPAARSLITGQGFFRSWPAHPEMDGFFAAVLERGRAAP